ncbi:hypothetical protein D3C76_958280 [compost metagenome]
MAARHAKALGAPLPQHGVEVEGPGPGYPLLEQLHQQGEQHHGKQQVAQPWPAQQGEQEGEQGQLEGRRSQQVADLKPARVWPQPLLQALDQRQLCPVQGAAFGTEVRHPLHLALGHLGQPGGEPVELRREAALIMGQAGGIDQPGVENFAAEVGGLKQGDKTRAALGPDGGQRLAGEYHGALPATQLPGDPAMEPRLLEQLPQSRLGGRLAPVYVAATQAVAIGDPVLDQQQILLVADHAGGRTWGCLGGEQGG